MSSFPTDFPVQLSTTNINTNNTNNNNTNFPYNFPIGLGEITTNNNNNNNNNNMATVEFPLQFKRQYQGPIDVSSVHESLSEVLEYINNDPTAYAGQVLAITPSESHPDGGLYMVKEDGGSKTLIQLATQEGVALGYTKAESDAHLATKSDVGHTHVEADITDLDKYTQAEVDAKIAGLVDSAPETLDTLNELAAALGDDPDFATSIATSIGTKADQATTYTKTEVDALNVSLTSSVDTKASQATTYTKSEVDASLATKADQTAVDTSLAAVNASLATKADQTSVDASLALKSDQTTVDAALATKADQTSVDAALATKADQTSVDASLATKADQTTVDASLATKADQATTYTKTEVDTAIAGLVDTAPEALDTLNELAAALGDDPDFATSVATQIGTKADQTSVDASLATKADQTTVDAALATKADQTAVDASLATKADQATTYTKTEVDSGLATKSDVGHTHVESDITDLDKYTQAEVDASLATKADQATTYSKTEVDSGLATKSDVGHTHVEADITDLDKYTQAEVDASLATKADQATTYSKTEVDAIESSLTSSVDTKADQATTYTKTEVDALDASLTSSIDTKADQATTYTKTEVDSAIAGLVDTAPEALDTLNELASALGDDPDFATSVATQIGTKADQATTYSKTEVDAGLATKSDVGHTHVEADITDLDKYTQSEVDAALALKSDQTVVDAALATKADQTVVDAALATKADQTSVDASLATKADQATTYTKTEVDSGLATKSDVGHTHVEADITDLDKYTQAEVDASLATKADQATTYTKTEVDSSLATKADQTSVDASLATKADQATTYTKTEVDSSLATKADQATTYTKTEVDAKVAAVVDSAPEALDTLNELAAALGDDANFATSIATQIGTKADQTSVDASLATKSDVGHTHTDEEVSLSVDITSDIEIGSLSQAQTIPAGTSVQDVLELLLFKTYFPTYSAPSASLADDIAANVEVGTIGLTLDAGFSAGSINGGVNGSGVWDANLSQADRAGAVSQYTFSGASITTTSQAGDVLALPSTVIGEGVNSFTVDVDHAAGVQPVDSKGGNFETALSVGSVSASITVNGKRNSFFGVDLASADSAGVRALAGSELGLSGGSSFTINIPAGSTDVAFAYPAGLGAPSSVTHLESNFDVKGVFSEQTVSVEGANGFAGASYKVCTYTPTGGFNNEANYTVTI